MSSILWPMLRQSFLRPTATAVIDDRRTWRYIDLAIGSMYLAEQIEKATTKQNVGILLPTSGAFPMALMGILALGKTAVPLNYLLSHGERQFIVEDSEIDTVITVGQMIDFLGKPPENVKLIKLEEMSFNGCPPLRWPHWASADEIAVILYTSGTSGQPKGVMLSHGNLRSDVEAAKIHAGISAKNSFLGVLPQFHSFGLTGLTLLPLCSGAKIIYTARFVPRRIIELIKVHRPDSIMAIPSMYNALLGVKNASREDFESVSHAISGGEPLPESVYEGFQSRFGVRILEGYGLTETSPIVAWSSPEADRHKSVGTLVPGAEAEVRDDAGNPVARGEEGEIFLRGPMIMKGYYKRPDLTQAVIASDGYFRTGDWGKYDEDGFLFITGRVKEMLIIGGENVFPREIEEVLNQHDSVLEAAVIGKQDPSRGEVAVAFVELQEGCSFDESELRSWCRNSLAGFKVPREIRLIEALPRNPTGKILRRQLVDQMKSE